MMRKLFGRRSDSAELASTRKIAEKAAAQVEKWKKEQSCWEKAARQHEKLADRVSALQISGASLRRDLERLQLLAGRLAAERSRSLPPDAPLSAAEFRAYSQWGEDGIVQFLLKHVPVEREIFVEFGVQDYSEAITRFLLMNDNWKGLILDGSEEWMSAVMQSDLAWRHDLTARSAWITAENINDLIASAGISGDIGLLSVDVDGVDYWIWKAIECVRPRIVVCEYNSLFGPIAPVTMAYDPAFQREKAHASCVLYGMSIAAAHALGKEKGYRLVGSNTAGNNAFFVREDVAGTLPARGPEEAWRKSRFREARGPGGALLHASHDSAREIIREGIVFDLRTGATGPLHAVEGW